MAFPDLKLIFHAYVSGGPFLHPKRAGPGLASSGPRPETGLEAAAIGDVMLWRKKELGCRGAGMQGPSAEPRMSAARCRSVPPPCERCTGNRVAALKPTHSGGKCFLQWTRVLLTLFVTGRPQTKGQDVDAKKHHSAFTRRSFAFHRSARDRCHRLRFEASLAPCVTRSAIR